jgi:hypothetical protein
LEAAQKKADAEAKKFEKHRRDAEERFERATATPLKFRLLGCRITVIKRGVGCLL